MEKITFIKSLNRKLLKWLLLCFSVQSVSATAAGTGEAVSGIPLLPLPGSSEVVRILPADNGDMSKIISLNQRKALETPGEIALSSTPTGYLTAPSPTMALEVKGT